jgi:hypothetical protein
MDLGIRYLCLIIIIYLDSSIQNLIIIIDFIDLAILELSWSCSYVR